MRVFAIYNPLVRNRQACGWVKYEPVADTFSIELARGVAPQALPAALGLYAAQGQREIPDRKARPWLLTRVPPEERQNIEDISYAHHMADYYLPALLAGTKGRSSHDDFLMEEVPSTNYRSFDLNRILETPVELGTQLSRARRAAGLTQQQLAEVTGVQQAVISRIERGKGNPTLETMEILARGCGRTLSISLE